MSRHDIVIIKDTHRGLLYEDGVHRDVLPAGRYHIPRPPSAIASIFGVKRPKVELVMVDVRGRDRTVVVPDFLTADGATITASFVVQYRVADPLAAIHGVKSFEERLFAEVQAAARRALRGMCLEEVLGARDEIGEELLRVVSESSTAYGLEVTGLDFKDLVVPDHVRKLMNRAVLAKRLRHAQEEAEERDETFPDASDDHESEVEDDRDLVFAQASFRRGHASAEARSDEPTIRPIGFATHGLDGGRRRVHP